MDHYFDYLHSYFKFSECDEVVDAVVFLLSDRASMIHGVALPVDGGLLV